MGGKQSPLIQPIKETSTNPPPHDSQVLLEVVAIDSPNTNQVYGLPLTSPYKLRAGHTVSILNKLNFSSYCFNLKQVKF